jgi:hypothetical protein
MLKMRLAGAGGGCEEMKGNKQFQGSKKKARRNKFAEREADRMVKRSLRKRLAETDDIDELAALMGIKLV